MNQPMNEEILGALCAVLKTMKADVPWSREHLTAYRIGLDDLSDEAGKFLAVQVLRRFDWRPSVKELRSLWSQVEVGAKRQPEDVVAKIMDLHKRYAEFVIPDPVIPRLMHPGEPNWTDPVMQAVIATFGGWVAFCNDDSPSGVLRGQLLKIAASVLAGQDNTEIAELHREYLAARQDRKTLAAPALEEEVMLA